MRKKEQQAVETASSTKQYKYLYRLMLLEENIRKAYKRLRKGKTKRIEIQQIDADLDNEVRIMQEMIKNTRPSKTEHPALAYRPKKRSPKFIKEHGKVRKIYMPEIHEQWLHHIIVLILEPIITATAYPYSCGSFPRRGAHYGKRQMERWIDNGKGIRNFAKIDIRHFYDNIRIDILMKEIAIRIKDEWFLYIIRLCLKGFGKGIPLGFYISQWLANYILEPLDWLIVKKLELKRHMRYMDDIVIFDDNKKKLHTAVAEIRKFLGRRFRLKLKRNYQVCRFHYEKGEKKLGRALDYMGFLFHRNRVTIRKSIMLSATRLVARMDKAKHELRGYYRRHIQAMLSYMGWFSCTDTYECYEERIKPHIDIGRLKKIISKLDRRKNRNERMERGTLCHAA